MLVKWVRCAPTYVAVATCDPWMLSKAWRSIEHTSAVMSWSNQNIIPAARYWASDPATVRSILKASQGHIIQHLVTSDGLL